MTASGTFTWDGLTAQDVGARLGISNIWMYAEVESTQDIAHGLAEQGVPAGAVVVADAQRSGRGRQGRNWASQPGQGVWCTIIERPWDSRSLEVLSLRVGLRLAQELDSLAGARVMVKWPNDLMVGAGKLGGILCEARWSGSMLGWVAIGVGLNVSHPGVDGAAALRPNVARVDVLEALVRAVRGAAAESGSLSDAELRQFAERDALAGKRIVSPARGMVQGIDHAGGLLVRTDDGVMSCRSGTIQLENVRDSCL